MTRFYQASDHTAMDRRVPGGISTSFHTHSVRTEPIRGGSPERGKDTSVVLLDKKALSVRAIVLMGNLV